MILMLFLLCGCAGQAVTLCYQHGNQLVETYHHCSGVNAISLCLVSHCTGEVSGLPWIDNRNLKTFGLKRAGYSSFMTTSSLHQNQRHRMFSEFGNNGTKAISAVVCSELCELTGSCNVQCRFGNTRI